jgi:hypothetical protein
MSKELRDKIEFYLAIVTILCFGYLFVFGEEYFFKGTERFFRNILLWDFMLTFAEIVVMESFIWKHSIRLTKDKQVRAKRKKISKGLLVFTGILLFFSALELMRITRLIWWILFIAVLGFLAYSSYCRVRMMLEKRDYRVSPLMPVYLRLASSFNKNLFFRFAPAIILFFIFVGIKKGGGSLLILALANSLYKLSKNSKVIYE